MLKIIFIKIIRFILSFFKIFKLKQNRCFFISYGGTQYSCNPKYIYLMLLKQEKEFDFIWGLYDASMLIDESAKIVRPKSFKYYYYFITSKYVFTNIEISSSMPKKKNSVWIKTWHGGGAYKRCDLDVCNIYQKMQRKRFEETTDFFISSSSVFSKLFIMNRGIPRKKIIGIGMPRNDILFFSGGIKNKVNLKIREMYKIPEKALLVLYAPTYRGKSQKGNLELNFDFEHCQKALEKKWNRKVYFLVRTHHYTVNNNFDNFDSLSDAKSYPDMQELIIASDVLITDYSSTLWDYCLTKKPGFLFTPDVEEYRAERGFYTDISEWPYPYAKTNEELFELIMNYDEKKSVQKISDYLEKMGSYENGTACKQIIEKVINCGEN